MSVAANRPTAAATRPGAPAAASPTALLQPTVPAHAIVDVSAAAVAAAPAPVVRIDRLVVEATGGLAYGNRLAQRLPAALERAVAREGMPADERALRALVDRTVREVAR